MNKLFLLIAMLDGSVVNLKVPETMVLEFKTTYGQLKIPAKDIKEVNVGVHVDNAKLYEQHVKNLSSDDYKLRDTATKFFKMNQRNAYKYILPLKNSMNPEVNKRVNQLLNEYKVIPRVNDSIVLFDSTMTGYIENEYIEGISESIGPLKLKLSQIKGINAQFIRTEVRLKHSKDWMKIGWIPNGRILIKAHGQVDLYPQTPGQYMCSPKGYDTNGLKGGALMGKINGKVFYIGDYFDGTVEKGELELRISDSPWPPSLVEGFYEVTIE